MKNWYNTEDLTDAIDLDNSAMATAMGGEAWYKNPNTYIDGTEVALDTAEVVE